MMQDLTPEQRQKGMDAWMKWMGDNKASLVDGGAPLGKTKRVDLKGASDTKNDIGGYSIVQANSAHAVIPHLWQGPSASANAGRVDRGHRGHANPGDVRGPIHSGRRAARAALSFLPLSFQKNSRARWMRPLVARACSVDDRRRARSGHRLPSEKGGLKAG